MICPVTQFECDRLTDTSESAQADLIELCRGEVEKVSRLLPGVMAYECPVEEAFDTFAALADAELGEL